MTDTTITNPAGADVGVGAGLGVGGRVAMRRQKPMKRPSTAPIGPDRHRFLAQRLRALLSDCSAAQRAAYRELRARLLGFGGATMVAPFEPEGHLRDILERSVLRAGCSALMNRGRPKKCHENAARLWWSDPDRYALVTGYALLWDGAWREHSWCVDRRVDRIVETTVRWLRYYGYVLTPDEASAFVLAQLP